jgi:hypothetical protein
MPNLDTAKECSMRPYLFWFSYMDPDDPDVPEEDLDLGPHVHYCIMLGESPGAVQAWEEHLAHQYQSEGSAETITRTWIEQMVPELLTDSGPVEISWLTLSPEERWELCHCVASNNPTRVTTSLNAGVQADNERTARHIWVQYLQRHYPDHIIEVCSRALPPIISVGQAVDWSS